MSSEFQVSWAYKKYCLALGITVTIPIKSSRGLEVSKFLELQIAA